MKMASALKKWSITESKNLGYYWGELGFFSRKKEKGALSTLPTASAARSPAERAVLDSSGEESEKEP